MKNSIYLLTLCILISTNASAQMSPQKRDSINQLSAADHQLMMKELGISTLRPGPSGNPDAPNSANVDESKASPYTSLPDPLVFNNGNKVTTTKQWAKRRLEIMEDFDREIYGRVPKKTPKVSWKVISEKDTSNGEYPVHISYSSKRPCSCYK